MGRNIGKIIAAVGAFGGGYLKGKRDKEEADARAEERQWRREDRARLDAERQAAAETMGQVGKVQGAEASGEEALTAGQQAMQNAMSGAATDEERAQVEQNYAPTIQALTVQRGLPGKAGTEYTQEQAQGDFVKRMYQIDPTKAMQAEAQQMTLDEGRDKAGVRKKLKEVDASLRSWGEKNIPKNEDGTPALNDDTMIHMGKMRVFELGKRGLYDEALKTADQSMQYATRKIQTEQVERQAAVRDAVAAAGMGDYNKAMEVYNRFVPDGSKATGVVQNKDGSFSVQRVSAVDGTPLAPGKFKNMDQFVSSLQSLSDSNALTAYVDRTFKHDIETRRLGLEGARVDIARKGEDRAAAKDNREQARMDAVSKGLSDYAAAEEAGDTKAMSAARRMVLANGGKLDRPEVVKPEVKVGNLGDITVSQPTGGGGVQVTNYGPDMKPKGTVSVAPPGSPQGGQIAAPKSQAEFDKLPAGTIYVDPKDGKKYRKP